VLRQLTKRFFKELREYDHIGRYGGEEFLLITPGIKENSAEDLYKRLQKAIASKTFHCHGHDLAVTVSIGVASSNGRRTTDEIIAAADTALLKAKRTGRNRVVCAEACFPMENTST
jgi:diguanylate cyclase (GGDEF)-like protein